MDLLGLKSFLRDTGETFTFSGDLPEVVTNLQNERDITKGKIIHIEKCMIFSKKLNLKQIKEVP